MKKKSCYLFVGILSSLIFVNCSETKVSKHRSTKSTNISTSDSCETSPVRQNVTLRGGIKAGYFHKLAQYVAMELCVQLCCQEKGCDVAFMIGKNCYGVKCFSEELCHVVPAKNAPRALMISKVDFRGEVYFQKFMPERLKCFQTLVEHNVTLHGGLQAGNFTAVGHVENIDACARLCCVREDCNLALMVNSHCFMVQCLNKERCRSMPVINQQFHTHIARVNRTKVIAKEHSVRALSSSPGKTSKLMCKNGMVQYNQTLLGGYDAGKYKLLSHSTNMSSCIRLCCGEMKCDVAFMIEKKCYGVVCTTLRLCQTIPAKKSAMLNHLSPTISYITSRNEEVNSVVLRTQSEVCKSNVISYDVTLRDGRRAGKYKTFGPVDNMAECIRVCCIEKYCDLAFMINGTCFTVRCHTEKGCQEVPSTGSGYKPMISYVLRETSSGYHKKQQKSHWKNLKQKHNHKGSYRTPTKTTSTSELPHIPSPSLPSVDSEHYCTNSEIMYNVTLRGGITSGTFRDRGALPNMQECLRICCIATSCDLAFMLSNHCFSVSCKNQSLCEVVTARSSGYKPQIAYIYARSNVANHDLNKPRFQTHSQGSLPLGGDSTPTGSFNTTIYNYKYHKSKYEERKNPKVTQISLSRHKHKSKRRRRKKYRKNTHMSNREKLKHMYAQEKILLRKLSLLKLRMEMIKRKSHEEDKNAKDSVLLQAFEEEPKTSQTSLDELKNPQISRNATKLGTRKNVSVGPTSRVVEKNTSKKVPNRNKKQSANNSFRGKSFPTKHTESFDKKGAKDNNSEEKDKQLRNNIFAKQERKLLAGESGNITNLLTSSQRNGIITSTKHSITKITKEIEKFKTFSNSTNENRVRQTQETKMNEQDDRQKSDKHAKIIIEKEKQSLTPTKGSEKQSKGSIASLQEMISETTEAKGTTDSTQRFKKTAVKWKNLTFGEKNPKNENIGNLNSLKNSSKKFVNIFSNISISGAQSEKNPQTRTIPEINSSSVTKELNPKSQDSFRYSQETRNDLMLLEAFSEKMQENDLIVKPTRNHSILPRNSSRNLSRHKKGDNL